MRLDCRKGKPTKRQGNPVSFFALKGGKMTRLIDTAYMRDKSGNIHKGQALWLALTIHTKKQSTRRPRKRKNV